MHTPLYLAAKLRGRTADEPNRDPTSRPYDVRLRASFDIVMDAVRQ